MIVNISKREFIMKISLSEIVLKAGLMFALVSTFSACSSDGGNENNSSSIEYEGQTYKTVAIGTQIWMAENLNYNVSGSKCYDNDPANCAKYGRLYNLEMAMKVCPSGWHIPNDNEWDELLRFLESMGEATARTYIYTNFAALPSGGGYPNGSFSDVGNYSHWWKAGEIGIEIGIISIASNQSNNESRILNDFDNASNGEAFLFSVRCIQGYSNINPPPPSENICGGAEYDPTTQKCVNNTILPSFTDNRDNEKYSYVTIGTQTWMAENLNYNVSGGKCYDNVSTNCNKYGRLYDWATARTACPIGWHIPNDTEWTTLINYVGGEETAGTKLKANSGWLSGNGTNNYNFSALPGGSGNSDGSFSSIGNVGRWWTATEVAFSNTNAYTIDMIGYAMEKVTRNYEDKTILRSVRCVKD
jgi:uncharacterized protein (TIGR02145 family)